MATPAPQYLSLVRAYADALIAQGRDVYGSTQSPLFAAALDVQSMQPGAFPDIAGIRAHDRATHGANPMHDENLYQILYALSEITAEKRYAAEADKALRYFFENCQSPATGLMAWGEHIQWDFRNDAARGDIHEFFRPWVLWEKCFALAPDACVRFADGLWRHQIHNHETGEFSRHASWSKHQTGRLNEYPRHAGFYIATWAQAYRRTRDPVCAKAVETLVDMFNRVGSKRTGAIPCSSNPERAAIMWPESCLSLAVDLTDAAPAFPEPLKRKMLECAAGTDGVYLRLDHDFSPGGIGFVSGADIHTLEAFDDGPWTHTEPWATAYGEYTDAQVANICRLRWAQLSEGDVKNGYRDLILGSALRYLESTPDLNETIYPGPLGDAILHMLGAFEMASDSRYLKRAHDFAAIAVDAFLGVGVALPKASSKHEHYEAITRADTLMMAFLELWRVASHSELDLGLVYAER